MSVPFTTRQGCAGLDAELRRLRDAGVDDVVLMPCTDDVAQVTLAADVLDDLGITADPDRTLH